MTSKNDPTERSALLNSDESEDYGSSSAVINESASTTVSNDNANVRWKSIRICYLTFFISSLGFSICMSSVWPYLQQTDTESTESFLGWVIAAFSIGQLVSSPILGLMFDMLKQAKLPLIISQVFSLLGSLLYSYVHLFPSNRRYALLAARFVIGMGAGNGAVIRSFVAGATTVDERTTVMATVSMTQSLGFIIGPAIQAAFTGLGYPGPLHSPYFTFDMFTSAGILSIVLGIFNLMVIIIYFKEFFFEARSENLNNPASINSASMIDSEDNQLKQKPDSVGAVVCIAAFCVLFYNFSTLETIMTPLSEVMFAWNKEQASLYNGIALAICGVISMVAFVSIKCLVKVLSENDLIVGGLTLTFAAFALLMPWHGQPPPLQAHLVQNSSHVVHEVAAGAAAGSSSSSSNSVAGCSSSTLPWCNSQPAVSLPLAAIAISVHSVGYPIAMVMISTVISKVLGPMRQGTWMGLLTGGGSLSRCAGPIIASQLFAHFGPQTLFLTSCGLVLLALIVVTVMADRLVPYDVYRMRRQRYSTYPAI